MSILCLQLVSTASTWPNRLLQVSTTHTCSLFVFRSKVLICHSLWVMKSTVHNPHYDWTWWIIHIYTLIRLLGNSSLLYLITLTSILFEPRIAELHIRMITVCWVGGVINTGSGVGVWGGSSAAEPVPLVDSFSQVAPATHVALKLTMSRRRTQSVCQLCIIKSHVSLLGGASLHTFHHDLKHKACNYGNCLL